MSCAVVSCPQSRFNFGSKSTKTFTIKSLSTISFRSQFTKTSQSQRGHYRASFKAFYAPTQNRESSNCNFYDVLGITESGTVSESDIKKAYKQMARKYHPDVSPPDRVDEYTQRFILVKEAYETLSDPQSRALYDHDLAFNFSSGRGYQYQQRSEQRSGDWKMRWQSQLNELKQRQRDSEGSMSWGARMRSRR